jgi:hypothetical protein
MKVYRAEFHPDRSSIFGAVYLTIDERDETVSCFSISFIFRNTLDDERSKQLQLSVYQSSNLK